MQVVTASGQVLSQITIEELSRKAGAPSLCVHRADLLRTFAETLELSVIRTNATASVSSSTATLSPHSLRTASQSRTIRIVAC